MRNLLITLSIIGFISCTKKNERVVFSGKIINPTHEFVKLYKDNKLLDSAKLNSNNEFLIELEKVSPGIHHFSHHPQYQYIFLEPGDSVAIRLNASPSYFDESLVFSGSNEDLNNFLIEMFLSYEDEEGIVYNYYYLPPETFQKRIDSLRDIKLKEFSDLSAGSKLSDLAIEIALAAIEYKNYTYLEKYPFYHRRKTGNEILNQLDSDFYKHRREVAISNENLTYFRPYYEFLNHYFGNLAYSKFVDSTDNAALEKEIKPSSLNRYQLKLIDSLIPDCELKENLLRNVTMEHLLNHKYEGELTTVLLKDFKRFSKSKAHHSEIDELYNSLLRLRPNNAIPNMLVEDYFKNQKGLKDICAGKKTLVYFWSADQRRHMVNISKQIEKLKKQNPEYQYIGLGLGAAREEWKRIVKTKGLDSTKQFWVSDFGKVQQSLVLDGLNKCIITHDTLLVDGFANVYNLWK